MVRVRPGQPPFMQKNLPTYAPEWLARTTVWAEASRREIAYALVADRRGAALVREPAGRRVSRHAVSGRCGIPTRLPGDGPGPAGGRRVRGGRRHGPAGRAGAGRCRAGRCREDQRVQGSAHLRAARPCRSRCRSGRRGGGDPGARRPRGAAGPGAGDDRVRPGRARRQGLSRLDPSRRRDGRGRVQSRGSDPVCRCRSRWPGPTWMRSRPPTSRSGTPPGCWRATIAGRTVCRSRRPCPPDLVAEGHEIPIARVQAMHAGKRRARAKRSGEAP